MEQNESRAASFSRMYDEHVDAIFRFLSYRLNDRERAKELTQETFTRAWTYVSSGKDIRATKPFLYTIANNLFKNELRAKREKVSLEQLMDTTAYEPESAEPTPLERAQETEVLTFLHKLKDEYRDILILRYVDDLPVTEIAHILGINPITASVRIHRAHAALRKLYTTRT